MWVTIASTIRAVDQPVGLAHLPTLVIDRLATARMDMAWQSHHLWLLRRGGLVGGLPRIRSFKENPSRQGQATLRPRGPRHQGATRSRAGRYVLVDFVPNTLIAETDDLAVIEEWAAQGWYTN